MLSPSLRANATLTWRDNSDNEDGFYVERSKNKGAFERIATTPRDTTSFTDSTAASGVFYRYRVQAFNASGVSGYTNDFRFKLPGIISYHDWIAQFLSAEPDLASSPSDLELAATSQETSQILAGSDMEPEKTLAGALIPNLLCYAHGINPFDPDFTLLPKPVIKTVDGSETRTIERALFKYTTGLSTQLQGSSDLQSWTDLPLAPTVTRETALHRWEIIPLPPESQGKFYRLKISLADPPTL